MLKIKENRNLIKVLFLATAKRPFAGFKKKYSYSRTIANLVVYFYNGYK